MSAQYSPPSHRIPAGGFPDNRGDEVSLTAQTDFDH